MYKPGKNEGSSLANIAKLFNTLEKGREDGKEETNALTSYWIGGKMVRQVGHSIFTSIHCSRQFLWNG